MAQERRKWTAEEDAKLREVVQSAIEKSQPILWCEIAESVPGRSNKDCRRRWHNSLAGGLSKGFWTESEDERLWNAVHKHGKKWAQVAQEVRTRNSDQCSSHWSQTLNPDIDFSDWTWQEDQLLLKATERLGTNWTMIAAKHLPARTNLALRNRYNALRKRMADNGKPKQTNRRMTSSSAGRSIINTRKQNNSRQRAAPPVKSHDEPDERRYKEDEDDCLDKDDDDDSNDSKYLEEDFPFEKGLREDFIDKKDINSSLTLPNSGQNPAAISAGSHPTSYISTGLNNDFDFGAHHNDPGLDAEAMALCFPNLSPFTFQDASNYLNVTLPGPSHATPVPLTSYAPNRVMRAVDPCVDQQHPGSAGLQMNLDDDVACDTGAVDSSAPIPSHSCDNPSPAALEPVGSSVTPLQHASINVVCTSDQLTQIMGAVVGIAGSITLKLENRNGTSNMIGQTN